MPNSEMKRTVFYLSDRTGITTEKLAHCLLTQFEHIRFDRIVFPYLDSEEKAQNARQRIDEFAQRDGQRPLVFSTLIDDHLRGIIKQANCYLIDFFDAFINPLEVELGTASSHAAGRTHSMQSYSDYKLRMDALNFSLATDDGTSTKRYQDAEVIVIGASRSGKTPTCLYLALNNAIFAANYPITEDELPSDALPTPIRAYKDKLIGLLIDPQRLQQIRAERKPNSRYASLEQCRFEIENLESLYRSNHIQYIDSTTMSIEEIAASIMHLRGLQRRTH